jgi:predicted ester cyclase
MSPSFYPLAAWVCHGCSLLLNNEVLVSPFLTSSIALAIAIAPTLGATQSISDESLTSRNKAVVHAYLDEIAQSGNIIARERYFASTTPFNGDSDLARQFSRIVETRLAFPDLQMTIEQQIAEGPWVATRVTYRGTHMGEFAGIPATGRRIEYSGTAMDRLENGKVVEMWHTVNMHLLLRQITEGGRSTEKPK